MTSSSVSDPSYPHLRWIVSQIGAREHYAVARALENCGHLERVYTDFWCPQNLTALHHAPQPLKSLASRRHSALPASKVTAFSASTLRSETRRWVASRLRHGSVASGDVVAKYAEFIRVGTDFALRCRSHLQKQQLDPRKHVFFGYNTGCLETLEWLREQGIFCIVDQIDPARVEEELVHQEFEVWPGWEIQAGRVPDAYYERLAAEWETASLVLVNSPWAATALQKQGVPTSKIIVVPLAFESPAENFEKVLPNAEPLTVLWLGTVNLRKGIPYFIEAARLLERTSIRFIVAGPLEISTKAVDSAPPNVRFLGRVARAEAAALYRQCDVFVLPTISDGFGITQLEAMTHGLPVVATPHCGEVVTSGKDGFIVPARDAKALAHAITELNDDRAMLRAMSEAARLKARQFSLNHYIGLLEGETGRVMERSKGNSGSMPFKS